MLSREGDGTAAADLLAVVEQALNSENVRPVADRLTVRSAEIIPYSVDATIFLYPGPEAEPVMEAAKASLQKYIASQTRLGRDIRRSAIYAALHVEGVQRVELASPLADVVLDKTQAASCTEWSVTNGERMNSLLPPGSSPLERRLAQTCSGISDLQVPLRDLWNPATCPVKFLPYLAWAFSVDRWDEGWAESVKRRVVQDAFYIHQHKGTTSAVRRVVEPFGFLIRIIEWWQTGEAPGVSPGYWGAGPGHKEETYLELERLIGDAKPCSRHLIGMSINLQTSGPYFVGAATHRRRNHDLPVYQRNHHFRWHCLRGRRRPCYRHNESEPMSAKFYTLLTDIGAAKLASAAALGVPLKITDGGGGMAAACFNSQRTTDEAGFRKAAR